MNVTRAGNIPTFPQHFTDYEDQIETGPSSGAEFVIPAELAALDDTALAALHTEAVSHFDALYADGQSLSVEDIEALTALTEGIESLAVELSTRGEHEALRRETAEQLAGRVHRQGEDSVELSSEGALPAESSENVSDPSVETPTDAPDGVMSAEGIASAVDSSTAQLVAGARTPVRVNLARVASRQTRPAQGNGPGVQAPSQITDVLLAAGEGSGYAPGQGITLEDVGRIVDRRLAGYNPSSFQAAARSGRSLRQQFGVATIRKPLDERLMIRNSDPAHVEQVMAYATNESRLPGGSLVASGGWCAPSVTLYDLFEIESRDGLFSLPTIGITRGGIFFTPGPNFSTIYTAVPGFDYTEAQDIAGTYDVDSEGVGDGTAGSKPCYKVPCPTFEEERLNLTGLCIQAGLLQARGYPEVISRTVRGALVAHDHRMSGRIIAALVTGSTAVTFPATTVGSAAPLLDAIEKQVEHYRYVHRLARGRTLEAVFPYWVRGALRSDLALRTGIDMLAVTDAQISSWFTLRGIAAQFVYDWQPITGAAGSFLTWPDTVQFLLYVAGTWVQGSSDVITLDTLYDSTLLADNDYTALFTEEGYLVAKRGHDSRVITVSLCADGSTGAPIRLTCDGSPSADGVLMDIAEDDRTNPVAGTLAASSLASTSFTLTVSGASDVVGLDAEPYRVSTDGGVTWTQWQTSAVFAITGLTTATTYYCRHEVRDAAGNTATGAIITALTT